MMRRMGWVIVLTLLLGACTPRPGPQVLAPSDLPLPPGARTVEVLVVTTRAPAAGDPNERGGNRSARTSYLDYEISIPPGHEVGRIEWPGRDSDPARNFTLRSQRDIGRQGFGRRVAGQRVGVYVHGFNTRYQEALFRTAQLSTDTHIEGQPILFTWPSEGNVSAYLADRDAADFSRAALGDLLVQLTAGRPVADPLPVLAHSMGGRLTMETLRQLRIAGRRDVLDRIELVLAAPDIDLDLFREQISVVGRMRHPVTVLVSSDDPALKISSRLAARRDRLGMVDVRDPMIQRLAVDAGLRILDITRLPTDDPAHSRYIGLISGEGGASAANPFDGVRQAGAFIFNQVGGVFQGIGGVLGD